MSIFLENQSLVYHYDAETVRIIPWGENAVRVLGFLQEEKPVENWALSEPHHENAHFSVSDDAGEVTVGKICARIDKEGHLVIRNHHGEILLEEYCCPGFLGIKAREWKFSSKGDYELYVRFAPDPDEKIYGMGQYQQEFLNLKGCDIELAHRNSQESIPFYLSSRGYGFLWNNPGIGRVFFAKNGTTWHMESAVCMDYWITAGDTPREIEYSYTSVTGRVPMMPEYAMGFWQSKCRYRTQEELLEVAREYKRRGLPLDVIVIDFFHWKLQGDWSFDSQYWPDPKAMCDELKQLGVEVMVSFWPTVDQRCSRYAEMEEKGFLMQMERGPRVSIHYMCDAVYYDAFNPEARKYVWKAIKENYFDAGIQHFWLDQAECDCPRYEFDVYRFQKGRALQILNYYPVEHMKGFYEGLRAAGQKTPVLLSRSAWCGAQKYGVLMWSGDIISSFQSFRRQLCAGLNTAIAGIPWWTTDIGGFYGARYDDPDFHELLQRWGAFGAFSPVMRMHAVREPVTPTMEGNPDVYGSGADNEVWSFGEETYEICKKYLFLRAKMKPYIQKLMKQASEFGEPVIRPMFYEFPEQENLYTLQEQYMFGSDILVAPVLYAGAEEITVVLPEKHTWVYAWSREEFAGGQKVTVETPRDIIPVFIKKGSDCINYFI